MPGSVEVSAEWPARTIPLSSTNQIKGLGVFGG